MSEYLQLVETLYSEPGDPQILGSFLADEFEIKSQLATKKRTASSTKAPRNVDIGDVFKNATENKSESSKVIGVDSE